MSRPDQARAPREPSSRTDRIDMDFPSRVSLLNLNRDALLAWLESAGQRPFRARQIEHWIYHRRATCFNEMHDLPQALRNRLESDFQIFSGKVVAHRTAQDRTEKLLLELPDGHHIECVLMRETGRRTVCISTQVGCAMGCVFCASGLLGIKRNLTTGEILEQVLRINRLLPADDALTNLVVMGIGEPLANLRNLLPALEMLCDPQGLGLGARRITISTVGLPDRIRELANQGKAFNLAVSLHAPNDALRTSLVPVNKSVGIDAILAAADEYFATTGRRVTYEYVLLAGRNDGLTEANQLGRLLEGRNAHVNLIPMNGVSELTFVEPSEPMTRQFAECLDRWGVVATIRKRKGADIDAACGQLRLKQTQSVELTMP